MSSFDRFMLLTDYQILLWLIYFFILSSYYREIVVDLFGLQSCLTIAAAASPLDELLFTKDGIFHISVFEDFHYGEARHCSEDLHPNIADYISAKNLPWGPEQHPQP